MNFKPAVLGPMFTGMRPGDVFCHPAQRVVFYFRILEGSSFDIDTILETIDFRFEAYT